MEIHGFCGVRSELSLRLEWQSTNIAFLSHCEKEAGTEGEKKDRFSHTTNAGLQMRRSVVAFEKCLQRIAKIAPARRGTDP